MIDAERPLNARSVVLSTLLGTEPPRMSARRLVAVGRLFGIGEGTVRTALTRMVQRGELTVVGDAHYQLSGDLVARQQRQGESRVGTSELWNGRWRLAVVTAETRSSSDRAMFRRAMERLRFANQREGVWLRPDNLPADRMPAARSEASAQCAWFVANPDGDDAQLAASLWDLDDWSRRGHELRRALDPIRRRLDEGDATALAPGFVLSAAVLRHLQADPLLPFELLDRAWPGDPLRRDYEVYDDAYRRVLWEWLHHDGEGSSG